MRIPIPPFRGLMQDLLYSLLLQGECIGFEKLEVDTLPASLNFPSGAVYALIICEASSSTAPANRSKVVRYKQLGWEDLPTDTDGMPLGEVGVTEIKGKKNLENFRAVSIDGNTHTLMIEYFM